MREASGRSKPERFKVLFVCMGNACRSPMAEAIARRDAADVIEACSAGIAPLGFVVEATKATLSANGYEVAGLRSRPLDEDLWDSANVVINITGRARHLVFRRYKNHAKVEEWEVRDPYGSDAGLYQKTFEELRQRVKLLAERLRDARE